jgi:hypothetical protein
LVSQKWSQWLGPKQQQLPPNQYSWLKCGPFPKGTAQRLQIEFARWLEINDPDDEFSFRWSYDGTAFWGVDWSEVKPWTLVEVNTSWAANSNIWVAWLFKSDGDDERAQGAWIDDLEIWQYNTPAQTCGGLDFGDKGVVIPAYETVAEEEYPTIRPGDEQMVAGLAASGANWARLVFKQQNGRVQLRDYDHMIDTLCANNISVLGVVNHQTLYRQDFNDDTPGVPEDYRNEFTTTVASLVDYFDGRITCWEVWNEPDYNPGAAIGQELPPFIDEQLYAPLLNATYNTIQDTNPSAKVLFGGLSSAGDGGNTYFTNVYNVLNNSLNGASPFDYFAIHPYFDPNINPSFDPEDYLHDQSPTIVAKFMEKMADEGDGSKKLWITEIGWNSADENDPRLDCWQDKVVTRREQANYLTSSFDILFNEVTLWGETSPAIEKVVWYQYMDVGVDQAVVCPTGVTAVKGFVPTGYVPAGFSPSGLQSDPVPWEFGLYEGDKHTPKLAQCAFFAYPDPCAPIYLPMVMGGGNVAR